LYFNAVWESRTNQINNLPPEAITSMAVRVRRRHPTIAGRNREFDVVVTSQDYVLINETKSSLDAKDVSKFADNMAEAREFFPELNFADTTDS